MDEKKQERRRQKSCVKDMEVKKNKAFVEVYPIIPEEDE